MDNDWLTIERDGESVNLTKCSHQPDGVVYAGKVALLAKVNDLHLYAA